MVWQYERRQQGLQFKSRMDSISKRPGTELQLQHNGFIVLEDMLNHTSGWNICLKRFKELINGIKK